MEPDQAMNSIIRPKSGHLLCVDASSTPVSVMSLRTRPKSGHLRYVDSNSVRQHDEAASPSLDLPANAGSWSQIKRRTRAQDLKVAIYFM